MSSYIKSPIDCVSIGDFFEGGYYTGMIWNQLTQTSTLMTIELGVKSFIVPDMTISPIVYEGQMLEIRSRSNPNNKFNGTVVDAIGSTLTIAVRSISGAGTFSDWSVMSRYRIIVSPKKYGEHTGVQLKSTPSPLPLGCQTLNEGWFSTNVMKHAGDAYTYPAAWWARGLVIRGYDDWYIPSRDELELCWRHLKPIQTRSYMRTNRSRGQFTNETVNGGCSDRSTSHGVNNNSYPIGNAYTSVFPKQTTVSKFKLNTGKEYIGCHEHWYGTSSEYNESFVWGQYWHKNAPGYQSSRYKSIMSAIRVVRRSII
jgi:hypothetical protein